MQARRRDFLKGSVVGTIGVISGSLGSTVALSGCVRSTPERVTVPTPVGFTWADHPLVGRLFIDRNSRFSTTFDHSILKSAGGRSYYVDVATGNDDNPGTSPDNALQSIAAACEKRDVTTVMVKGYGADTPYHRGAGFNNAIQSRSLNIVGYGYDRPHITTHDVLRFHPAAGLSRTYSTTRSNVTQCVDMAGGSSGVLMTRVTSATTCETLAGSWYQDGSTLYVHAPDSRNLVTTGGDDVWALLATPNFKSVGDYSSYLENLVLYGGTDCVNASGATPAGGYLLSSTFRQLCRNHSAEIMSPVGAYIQCWLTASRLCPGKMATIIMRSTVSVRMS